MSSLRIENHFNRLPEQPPDRKRQGQAGVVFAGLDRVDRLSGNAKPLRQIALGPTPLSPEYPQAVGHRYFRRTQTMPTHQNPKIAIHKSGNAVVAGTFGTAPVFASIP